MTIYLRGEARQFEDGLSVAGIARQIGEGLARAACACAINGEAHDLRDIPQDGDAVEIFTFDAPEGKHAFWHTTSHILAQAVKHLYPAARLAIGPAIDNGFYYDFDVETPFSPEDLEKIEAEMKKLVKAALPVERLSLSAEEAAELMKDEPYKQELAAEHTAKGEKLSFYRQGDFCDLCAGPHLMSTAPVKAFKLTSATGAYWRGDSSKRMLCRVYGISYPKKDQLEEYLHMLEEAKKRDHRKLGRELGLFTIMNEGPGFPFFLPHGMVLKNELISYWREVHRRFGYVEISTPMILNRRLWERSGHWEHYKQNMYTTVIDDEDYAIKPMNCPGGMLVYASAPHSYRDLPLRVGELGLVHRHELSGALHGLFRVRCFTQDDAHIFMTWDQMKGEIKNVVKLFDEVYSLFGLRYAIELSTMPEDHIGDEKDWRFAEETLAAAITEMGKDYVVNAGDGAFYGPKLDFHLADSLGRTWQCGTIQLDMQLPERFELEYTGADGAKHRPVMIHRVVFGSIERFIGVITEHFAGAFPLWLSPVQIKIIPISERHHEYAQSVLAELDRAGLRAEVDDRNEKMGYKIREAQLQKIPYMLVVGDREAETGEISVRSRDKGDLGSMSLAAFTEKAAAESRTRSLTSGM